MIYHQETLAENIPVQIFPNKIKNKIQIELLSPETMKLLGSTKKEC